MNPYRSRRAAGAALALAATLTAGCFTDSAGVTSAAASGASTSTGGVDSEGPATDATGTSGGPSTSSETDTTTSSGATTTSTTDAPTTDDTTTTTGGPLDGACAAACELLVACGLSDEACVPDCADNPPRGECLDAQIAALLCIAALDCPELSQPTTCNAELGVEAIACDRCTLERKGEAGACAAQYLCSEHSYEIGCEGQDCACAIDNDPAGGCSLDVDLCAIEDDALLEAAAGCCAWYPL
ncbi:MAG: hypothetical protein R3A79_30580 [Nannocystaceae bacterium]